MLFNIFKLILRHNFKQIYQFTKFQTIDFNKGLSNSSKTSQRFINNLYNEKKPENDNILTKPGSVIWIDNYSKFYKLTRPRR